MAKRISVPLTIRIQKLGEIHIHITIKDLKQKETSNRKRLCSRVNRGFKRRRARTLFRLAKHLNVHFNTRVSWSSWWQYLRKEGFETFHVVLSMAMLLFHYLFPSQVEPRGCHLPKVWQSTVLTLQDLKKPYPAIEHKHIKSCSYNSDKFCQMKFTEIVRDLWYKQLQLLTSRSIGIVQPANCFVL